METFKDIIGCEGLYQISNLGSVKNTNRNSILKPNKNSGGYEVVILYKNNKPNAFKIHRLIAIHFIDNPNNYLIVNHIDNVKTNNDISNLEWVTIRENTCHAYNLKNTSSKYPGVSWYKIVNKWRARIRINGKETYIGYYSTEELASKAYNEYLIKYNIPNRYSNKT